MTILPKMMMMQFKTYFLLFSILSVLYISPVNAVELEKKQLKVLTWNVYCLPFFINTTNRVERAKEIVEILQQSDYDVIVFHETFHNKSFRIIENGLKATFPYHVKANRKKSFLRSHHGIFMVSKYPFELLGTITYKNCKGTDCLSKKGAVLIELKKEAQLFQVLGTHLQSGNTNDKEQIRHTQRQQITTFLKTQAKPNIPQLLCGDFNTDYNRIDSRDLMLNDLEINQVNVPGEQTWPHRYYITKTTRIQILDYIFIKSNGFEFDSTETQVQHFYKKENKLALSDHAAVEVLLTW